MNGSYSRQQVRATANTAYTPEVCRFLHKTPPILHYILQQIFGTLDAHSVASKINNGVLTMDLHVWLTQAQY